MEFYLSAGYLRIPKKLFIKEMLQPNSPMKTLLNYGLGEGEKKRIISVDKNREQDYVIIDFTEGSSVNVGEDYRDLLFALKKKLQGDLTGQVNMSTIYEMNDMMNFTLNLNSPDGQVFTKN